MAGDLFSKGVSGVVEGVMKAAGHPDAVVGRIKDREFVCDVCKQVFKGYAFLGHRRWCGVKRVPKVPCLICRRRFVRRGIPGHMKVHHRKGEVRAPVSIVRKERSRAKVREILRDRFATAALQGLLSRGEARLEDTAKMAYKYADAMLWAKSGRWSE